MELQFKVTQLAMARVETRTHFQDLILGRMTGNPSGCPLFLVIQQESQSFIKGRPATSKRHFPDSGYQIWPRSFTLANEIKVWTFRSP